MSWKDPVRSDVVDQAWAVIEPIAQQLMDCREAGYYGIVRSDEFTLPQRIRTHEVTDLTVVRLWRMKFPSELATLRLKPSGNNRLEKTRNVRSFRDDTYKATYELGPWYLWAHWMTVEEIKWLPSGV